MRRLLHAQMAFSRLQPWQISGGVPTAWALRCLLLLLVVVVAVVVAVVVVAVVAVAAATAEVAVAVAAHRGRRPFRRLPRCTILPPRAPTRCSPHCPCPHRRQSSPLKGRRKSCVPTGLPRA